MYEQIKTYFQNLNPDIIVHAPSRINLINPLDAVEADSWMPAMAIEGKVNPLSVFLYLKYTKKNPKIKLYRIESDKVSDDSRYRIDISMEEELIHDVQKIKMKLNGEFKLIYASFYRISQTNIEFWKQIRDYPVEIGILSTIPRQSGLGGSSAIIIALLYGLAEYYGFLNNTENINKLDIPINKDTIAELCTKVEDKDLKITAGYSDRYVITRGGLSFCSYIGKLHHKRIASEPLAVYDRIDEIYNIRSIPIIICFSGTYHDSGDVHRKLRMEYLNQNQQIIDKYNKLSEIAWKARFSLMKRDWKELGQFFKENTMIMNSIMEIAGFKYGIGLANNILIKIIEKNPKVYAAKLTGAGGGGSVFALVNPDYLDEVFNYWKQSLEDLIKDRTLFKNQFPNYPMDILDDLKNADFFRVKINKTGVKKIY
ncbi:MAG: hypothetical protein GF311_00820 [Candidatus Lokiarchaeota archaeon]|nr:hypothetical protein [Candidatus Lokiarchaeota archaeon]